ncbi:excinuclease ABC subunit A [Pseudooceanicola sp.]|uniref:excinuclease ABC subunit A n=1 Tax=Pseudooceanicola sp. TaxID=1914328 RepID=UPI0035C6736C
MTRLTLLMSAALMTIPLLAEAKPPNDKGAWKARGAPGQTQGCPPGLAKKSPACVPPGLAKKGGLQIGDRLVDERYIVIRDPARYGLDPYGTYYRGDGYVYRVDRETREVLDLIGAVSAILN